MATMEDAMLEGRRQKQDRRGTLHWAEWRWLFGGRRRCVRRADQPGTIRMDWYPARLLGAAVMILGLSSLDAGFTLHLLEQGLATEVNPLMDSLLRKDVQLFVNLKIALTGSCMIVLVLHSQKRLFGKIRLEHILYTLAGLYMMLVGYEFTLITQF
jgi:hypothetical protein